MFALRESSRRKDVHWDGPIYGIGTTCDALLTRAQELGIRVRQNETDADGNVTFVISPESKADRVSKLLDHARSIGVTLRIL